MIFLFSFSCLYQQLGDYSILSINGATPRHDGNYTCYVSNAAASVNYTATLHIDGTYFCFDFFQCLLSFSFCLAVELHAEIF